MNLPTKCVINKALRGYYRHAGKEKALIPCLILSDFHADPQKKKKGKLKPMKVLKLLSPKDSKSKSPKDKKEKPEGTKR